MLELIVSQLGHVFDGQQRCAYEALSTRVVPPLHWSMQHRRLNGQNNAFFSVEARCCLIPTLANANLNPCKSFEQQQISAWLMLDWSCSEQVVFDISSVSIRVHDGSVRDVSHDGLLASFMYKSLHFSAQHVPKLACWARSPFPYTNALHHTSKQNENVLTPSKSPSFNVCLFVLMPV